MNEVGWRCFLVAPVPFVRRNLRRFTFFDRAKSEACPWGHDASTTIELVLPKSPDADGFERSPSVEEHADDPRWPLRCAKCGRAFEPDDERQVNDHRLYGPFPDGIDRPSGEMVPGATYDATWLLPDWAGPDGHCWTIALPSGIEWHVDGPSASDDRPWSRTGSAPDLTASPSINHVGHYHGWLRGGVLSVDCEGRTFPKWPHTAGSV